MQYAYDVYLDGKNIDTVFYSPYLNGTPLMSKEIKRELIKHDGYNVNIRLFVALFPVFFSFFHIF